MSKLQRPCNSQRRLITSASLRCLYKSLCVRDLQILKHAIRHQFSETAIPLKRCSQVRVSRRKINDGYQWRIQNFIIAGGGLPSAEVWIFTWKKWVLVHSGMTFYVQKGIRKGIQDLQCWFFITVASDNVIKAISISLTSTQKGKFVRASPSTLTY